MVNFIQCDKYYEGCDWLLLIICWRKDTSMRSRGTCFLCFVQHGARVWKCFRDYKFCFEEMKALRPSFKNCKQPQYTKI